MAKITPADRRFSVTLLTIYTFVMTLGGLFVLAAGAATSGANTNVLWMIVGLMILYMPFQWVMYSRITSKDLPREKLRLLWVGPFVLWLVLATINESL